MSETIENHEGKKYLREIFDARIIEGKPVASIMVDVYAVIEAFDVRCPARQQALKKLLATGQRGKGDAIADLRGALAATNRAIDLQRLREASTEQKSSLRI